MVFFFQRHVFQFRFKFHKWTEPGTPVLDLDLFLNIYTSVNPVHNAQVCVHLMVHITKLRLQTTVPKPLYIRHFACIYRDPGRWKSCIYIIWFRYLPIRILKKEIILGSNPGSDRTTKASTPPTTLVSSTSISLVFWGATWVVRRANYYYEVEM